MRRERPSRPKPQSVVITRRSGGIYSSALRISAATCSAGSTVVMQWLTTPMPIFLSVLYLAKSGRSLPSLLAHSKVMTVGIELQQVRQGALVARYFPVDPLLIGIAPASMHPDLGIDAGELVVERLGLEFELGIGAVGPGRQ